MSIIYNCINSLAALYNKKDKEMINNTNILKNSELFSPIDTIGRAISLVYTLDRVFHENAHL